ncbi:ParB-like protein [Caulobacter sp. S45]|uniref:ParB-like protein n=1 Tax=Caulobacter sp. S45 TaxID=1641861 RepID=UPI00131D9127|nr:ParB-like protein [Caulobacter sp. S45]
MSDPLPFGVSLKDLRPTQMTVGFREVEIKRRQWRDADDAERTKLLRRHVVPAVLGPKGRTYIVDHHHFTKALLEEKAGAVGVYIQADLSHLAKKEFWTFLDNSDWCHAYDAEGERRALSNIPKSISELVDDPFRSLVAELIRAGGCAKTSVPFFEFLWADFLRRRIKPHLVEADFGSALVSALELAKSPDAKSLPGWSGADPSQ